MRLFLLFFLGFFNLGFAQENLDNVPPPPAISEDDLLSEAEVNIIQQEGARVEEYRKGGKLYWVKVTPANAPAYYLVDFRGEGRFAPLPHWVLISW